MSDHNHRHLTDRQALMPGNATLFGAMPERSGPPPAQRPGVAKTGDFAAP